MLEDQGYRAKMLCDSISPDGIRLSTMEVTFPRSILAEFNTHRMLSKNSASSRAIPVEKQLKKIAEKLFVPLYWGKNQKGMQATEELNDKQKKQAIAGWREACYHAIDLARYLMELGVHKQTVNRLLEPFMWHTVIVSATEWKNFFALRRHKDTQPEFRKIAIMMEESLRSNEPIELDYKDWHLPLIQYDEKIQLDISSNIVNVDAIEIWKKVAVGRCARVSYLTHDGKRDLEADIKLCDDLCANGHMSPFEHVARPMTQKELQIYAKWDEDGRKIEEPFAGNFRGWFQFRKSILNEDDFSKNEQNNVEDK